MIESIQSKDTLDVPETKKLSTTVPAGDGPAPSPSEQHKGPVARLFLRLFQMIPTMLVLLGLAALAWWGHKTHWKLGAFSEMTGNHKDVEEDWCVEHGVAESECALCKPGLIDKPKSYGWCSVHGVYNCPWEHPEVAQTHSPPEITEEAKERAQRALTFVKRPENNSLCKLHPGLVQLASAESITKLGLDFDPVWTASIEETITAHGEVTYDKTKVASLASVVPGKVWRVEKQIGDVVKRGDVLALIDAVEVGKAKSELLQALAEVDLRRKNLERLKPLGGTAVPEALLINEESALTKGRAQLVSAVQALGNLGIPVEADKLQGLSPSQQNQRLQFLGLPESIVEQARSKTTTANLIPVRASLDGIVVDRHVVEGEMVAPSHSLFTVADTQSMWLKLYVRGEDVEKVQMGQSVRFLPDGSRQVVQGKVDWISTTADEKTRTIQARVNLTNLDSKLRASTFGTATIVLRTEEEAIVVPNDALHWDGSCNVVFVQDKDFHKEGHPKLFHVRNVRTGAKLPEQTEVIAGVLPGEVVATKGSGVLRSQLLKSNLGAG